MLPRLSPSFYHLFSLSLFLSLHRRDCHYSSRFQLERFSPAFPQPSYPPLTPFSGRSFSPGGFIFPLYLYLILPFYPSLLSKPILPSGLYFIPSFLIFSFTYYKFTTGKHPSGNPVTVYYSVQRYPSSPSLFLYLSSLLYGSAVNSGNICSYIFRHSSIY